jgi:hypothetical protein
VRTLFQRLRRTTDLRPCGVLLSLAAISASLSFAQQAALSGYVKDPTGAVVPNANVTATRTDTAAKWSTLSSDAGFYEFPALLPGPYEISVEKAGFQPLARAGLMLHISDRVQIDLMLTVGSTKETLTVEGDTELLNTSDASVSAVVERETVENMPLNGRSFQSLLNLMPGVNPINPGSGGNGSPRDSSRSMASGRTPTISWSTE